MTYSKYFDGPVSYLFKYDGLRERRQFTILIRERSKNVSIANAPPHDAYTNTRRDTDQPYDIYMDLLRERNIHISDCEVFSFFMRAANRLVTAFGKEVVFLLTMEMADDVLFCVYINNSRYEASTLKALNSYLTTLIHKRN